MTGDQVFVTVLCNLLYLGFWLEGLRFRHIYGPSPMERLFCRITR